MARELGNAIQSDERYITLKKIATENAENRSLQTEISVFNALQVEAKEEVGKEKPNKEKIQEYNAQMKEMYDHLMARPEVVAYQAAQKDYSTMFEFVMQILEKSANGMNPDEIEYEEPCSHDCSNCNSSSCHQ